MRKTDQVIRQKKEEVIPFKKGIIDLNIYIIFKIERDYFTGKYTSVLELEVNYYVQFPAWLIVERLF